LTTKEEHGGELTGGRRRRLELQLRRKARPWLVSTVAGDGAASARRRRRGRWTRRGCRLPRGGRGSPLRIRRRRRGTARRGGSGSGSSWRGTRVEAGRELVRRRGSGHGRGRGGRRGSCGGAAPDTGAAEAGARGRSERYTSGEAAFGPRGSFGQRGGSGHGAFMARHGGSAAPGSQSGSGAWRLGH
jgi:hypothetical protein